MTAPAPKRLFDVSEPAAYLESDAEGTLSLIPAVRDEQAAQWTITVIHPDGRRQPSTPSGGFAGCRTEPSGLNWYADDDRWTVLEVSPARWGRTPAVAVRGGVGPSPATSTRRRCA